MLNAVALVIGTFLCKDTGQVLGKYWMIKEFLKKKNKLSVHYTNWLQIHHLSVTT